jgi:hypothetical protein
MSQCLWLMSMCLLLILDLIPRAPGYSDIHSRLFTYPLDREGPLSALECPSVPRPGDKLHTPPCLCAGYHNLWDDVIFLLPPQLPLESLKLCIPQLLLLCLCSVHLRTPQSKRKSPHPIPSEPISTTKAQEASNQQEEVLHSELPSII